MPLEARNPDEALAWLESFELRCVLTPRAAEGSARIARRASRGRGHTLLRTGARGVGESNLPRVADRASAEVLERLLGIPG